MNLTNKKFELIESEDEFSKIFKSTWTYIKSLLYLLWEDPYVIYLLLSNANINDVKNNLAPFIANNFYQNILSSYYFEDNLMFVISLLLKDEINKLNKEDEPEKFLENTPCGFLLEQLCDKNDILSFCKINILNIVENLEWTFSSKRICFDIGLSQDYLKRTMTFTKNDSFNRRKTFNQNIYKKIGMQEENFISIQELRKSINFKFLPDTLKEKKNEEIVKLFNMQYAPDLTFKILEEKINSFEEKNNDSMKEYIKYQIEENKNISNADKQSNNDCFCNNLLIDNIYTSDISDELYFSYANNFLKTIESINSLFKNLIENSYLIPYSIKCICKIISNLITKKFPNIKKHQKIAFLCRFFFNKLLLPLFENPAYGALINELIITGETINNLKAISNIISKLCTGKFYNQNDKNGNYTPFNTFFIEAMPNLFKFFEDISEMNLPTFLEELIDNKLSEDFRPSYFVDHPDEIFLHRSILFCFDDLNAIINNMYNSKKILFERCKTKYLETTFNKIIQKNSIKILEVIKHSKIHEEIIVEAKDKKGQKIIKKGKEIQKYFLITNLLINEKNLNIFDLQSKENFFKIKELKQIETNEDIEKNNIIKIKNSICAILYNYLSINNLDAQKDKMTGIINIFNEIKKYIKLSNFIIDGSVPCEWYINLFFEYINKIPKNLANNNFELLFNEIKQDINNSIKSLNFDILTKFLDKIKFARRERFLYEQSEKRLKNVHYNKKAQNIIDNVQIPCELYFCYNEKEKVLNINEIQDIEESLSFLNYMAFKEKKKGIKTVKTIKSFTKTFPNIIIRICSIYDNINILNVLKELKVPRVIENYLKIIKKKMHSLKLFSSEEEYNNIYNKIYDFVTEKLYEKIYPVIPSDNDITIYNNCCKLNWTEPKHYIKGKTNFVLDTFLPDILNDFKQIHRQKSPRKKILYMRHIFNCIKNIGKLNGEDDDNFGLDEQISILTYSFIKAQPVFIETNCNYMELFVEKNGENDSFLTQLKVMCNFVRKINYANLNGVTQEEFEGKTKEFEEKEMNINTAITFQNFFNEIK